MNPLLYGIGSTGFFASRAFVPAFCTAAILRYGSQFPLLKQIPTLQATGLEPTWFTNGWVILVLGILAVAEIGATKIPEFHEAMDWIHKYARAGTAAASTFGVLPAGDIRFVEQAIPQSGMVDIGLSMIVAIAVWFSATLRNACMSFLADIDPDDDLGLQNIISWFEDGWSLCAVFLFFIYPLFMVILILIALGLLFAFRRYLEYLEEKKKIPCPNCNIKIYPSALQCQSCHVEIQYPKDLGFLGTAIDKPVSNRQTHLLLLTEKHRCPSCAVRLKDRKLPQICSCGASILSIPEIQQAYLKRIQKRLPKALFISFLFSLIPLVGVVPGIIYYRLTLVAPFKSYIPPGRGLALKWLLRIIFFFLITLQLFPILGSVMIPTMALISYKVYRSYFIKQMGSTALVEK